MWLTKWIQCKPEEEISSTCGEVRYCGQSGWAKVGGKITGWVNGTHLRVGEELQISIDSLKAYIADGGLIPLDLGARLFVSGIACKALEQLIFVLNEDGNSYHPHGVTMGDQVNGFQFFGENCNNCTVAPFWDIS